MSLTKNKVHSAMKHLQKGFESIHKANQELSSGPQSYYMEKMLDYVDTLFSRYAPFKEGDRVVIIKDIPCENGWASCKHFLIKGAQGTVSNIDLTNGKWRADIVFDNETWIDREGNEQPVSNKHTFAIYEDYMVKI